MRVEVLGPLRAEARGVEVDLGGRQKRLLVALLASSRSVATEQLLSCLWPDRLPPTARKTVQVYVSQLRKALGDPAAIVTGDAGYGLGPEVELDVADFERLRTEGRRALIDRPAMASALLREALELWRGNPFGDLRYEEALLEDADRLERLRLDALEDRIEADLATGRNSLAELEDLIAAHPRRERLRALHMTALYRAGRQAEAITSFQEFRTDLAEATGLDPSPELRHLEVRILNQDPSLGSDLIGTAASAAVSRPPVRYSSFVGRRDEISALRTSLRRSRLVTLVGPGGIGKSSTAARAIDDDSDVRVRVWADVERAEPGALAGWVADSMGLQPWPSVDPAALISGYLDGRPHLIVFDGCEPLLDEAATLADRLLTTCPDLSILATSREALGLAGEEIVHLGPLALVDAVALLGDRTAIGLAGLDRAVIERLERVCAALDGIPLAIELASARLRTMTLEHFSALLDDQVELLRRPRRAGERHGSLKSALDSSYRLLSEVEQRVFRMLSSFLRRFEPEAASVMVDHPGAVVGRLIEVSLIEPPDEVGECRMLEPVRQYAWSLLEENGEEAEAKRLHATWIARRCRRVGEGLSIPALESSQWLDRNQREIVAALEWTADAGEHELGVAIIASVGRELVNRGASPLLIEPAVPILTGVGDSTEAAVAMAHITYALHLEMRYAEGAALIDRAAAVAERTGDPIAIGSVAARRAAFLDDCGRPDGALEMLQRGIEMLEEHGGLDYFDLINLATMAVTRGRFALASDMADRLLEWERGAGWVTGDGDMVAAMVAEATGDLEGAIRAARRSVAGRVEIVVPFIMRGQLVKLADLLTYAERYREAAAELAEAEALTKMLDPYRICLPVTRMRVAAGFEDWATVLGEARAWLQWVSGTDGALAPAVPNREALLGGSRSEIAPFLNALWPATTAAMALGISGACRFAHASDSLMQQAPFEAWDGLGETARWHQLAARCGNPNHRDLQMTLDEAFDLAIELFGIAGASPSAVGEGEPAG